MKKIYSFYCCVFLFTISNTIAQNKQADSLISPTIQYEKDLYNKNGEKQTFNDKMLNILFADQVAKYFNGGSDLSLQKFYSSIEAEDSSLSFGVNFDPREESKLKKLTWLFSAGFKAKADSKFSTFVKNGKLDNSDLGITGKITLIGRGIINFKDKTEGKKIVLNRKEIIKKNREKLLTNYKEKINKYYKEDYVKDLDSLKLVYDPKYNSEAKLAEKEKEFILNKNEKYYQKIAEDEISFIQKNKLFKYVWNHWGTVDFFVPIGQKSYTYAFNNLSPDKPKSANFYPLKITGTYTHLFKWSSGQSIYLTGQVAAFNNNNVLADKTDATTFQTITTQSPTQQAVSSEQVYVLTNGFDRFITGVARFETVFFVTNWIGISPAIEKNFGQYYHRTNWKLGIPLSLKDKEGKPSINFELQWKEVNKDHLVGISASFLFGKFLN